MIAALDGWTFEVAGELVVLRLRDQPAKGAITYLERRRPCGDVPGLVARHLAELGSAQDLIVRAAETFLTDEGEYGALTRFDCVIAGRQAQHTIAHVVIDDFYAETCGVSFDPSEHVRFAAAVRALAEGDRHGMSLRRRPFRYTPPRKWQLHAGGSRFNSLWQAPDGHSQLVVPSAMPLAGTYHVGDRVLFAHMTGSGMRPQRRPAERNVHASPRLKAQAWELAATTSDGTRVTRFLAVLEDQRFCYALHLDGLDSAKEHNWSVLAAVVASIEPLPSPSDARTEPDNPFVWAVQ